MKFFAAILVLAGTIHAAHAASPTTLPACTGALAAPTKPPTQASAAGFNNLVFDDQFTTPNTISASGNGLWYPNLPSSGYTVSNGCLTILTDTSGYGDGIGTYAGWGSTKSTTFQHGYFEASIRFNPTGHQSGAWPAWWSYALEGLQGAKSWGELDFMEAYPTGPGQIVEIDTIHQWTAGNPNTTVQQQNNVPKLPAGTVFTTWHVYGCLWTPGTVTWYFDNQPMLTVMTGPGTKFPSIEQDHMALFLGTGLNWPMQVQYVHVWQ